MLKNFFIPSNNNQIEDYTSLKNIKQITLIGNKITNAELLESLTDVEYLDISQNNITNITPLNNLINLKTLILDENENIKGTLENNIEYLSLKNCKLKEFNITKLSKLNDINISNNNIDIINIIKNKKENIYIQADEIELTKEQVNYLIKEKETLNNKNIYFGLYKPIIKIDIETPYNLNNLEWLKIDNTTKIQNGTINNNILDIIEKNNPIIINLNNIGYTIYNPIIIFNVK